MVSGQARGNEAWFDLNNSNGTFPPSLLDSAQVAAQNSAGTDTATSELAEIATPASSDIAPFTTLGNITLPTVTDTVHPSTENCFRFLPSISVQGRASEVCDCGTTTLTLTTKGSTTGCALSNSIITINQLPTPTVTEPRATMPTTPMVISPKRTYPKIYLIKT